MDSNSHMVRTSFGNPCQVKKSDSYCNDLARDKRKTDRSRSIVAAMASNSKGKKHAKPHIASGKQKNEPATADTITWENLTGRKCRSWWINTKDDNHILKCVLRSALVDKVAQLSFFNFKDSEPYLRPW
ncbi:hypothetical protein SUGI_1147690 [Cryptomeria japonica]|nr:hypothetical protein SUGI_1147690 [Cryptomeria japonica]